MDEPSTDTTPLVVRRPKESWYHFVVPLYAGIIVLVFLVLMRVVDLPETVTNIFMAFCIPVLLGGVWWAIFRADRFSDEFQLAYSRQVESISFRFLVFWILAGEILDAAGYEWYDFDGVSGFIYAGLLGTFLTQRRVYGRIFPFGPNKTGGNV